VLVTLEIDDFTRNQIDPKSNAGLQSVSNRVNTRVHGRAAALHAQVRYRLETAIWPDRRDRLLAGSYQPLGPRESSSAPRRQLFIQ
jgi:hypothetical protein